MEDVLILVVGIVMGGLIVNLASNSTWERKAAAHECAYFDGKTGKFTWADITKGQRE